MKPAIKAMAFDDADEKGYGPRLEAVLSALSQHGLNPSAQTLQGSGDKIADVKQFLDNAKQPVIILHHETPANYHFIKRELASSNTTSNSTVTALTEFQISQYQICLWAAVLFILLIFSGVSSIVYMEVIPDSILFAKFQSTRSEKRE